MVRVVSRRWSTRRPTTGDDGSAGPGTEGAASCPPVALALWAGTAGAAAARTVNVSVVSARASSALPGPVAEARRLAWLAVLPPTGAIVPDRLPPATHSPI